MTAKKIDPKKEGEKLDQFIQDNPNLYKHVRLSGRRKLMYVIMRREEKLKAQMEKGEND